MLEKHKKRSTLGRCVLIEVEEKRHEVVVINLGKVNVIQPPLFRSSHNLN